MCGVFRTDNGGSNWEPWNRGLITERPTVLDQVGYVQDLIIVRRNGGPEECYAATLGGIFKAVDKGSWERDTVGSKYQHDYTKLQYGDGGQPLLDASIPFSCFAYCGGDILYAGAGSNRTSYAIDNWKGAEVERYPSLGDYTKCSNYQYCRFDDSYYGSNNQYTVWVKNLNSSASDAWEPLIPTVGDPGDGLNTHGAARDISVTSIDGITYLVVSTLQGVWLYINNNSIWIETKLSDNALYNDIGNYSTEYYRDELLCWNVYITKRGVIYASMNAIRFDGDFPEYPGGVYRMFLFPIAAGEGMKWFWVGNDAAIDNGEELPPPALHRSMSYVGRDTIRVKCGAELHYPTGKTTWVMNVIEGTDSNPDIILLGSRKSSDYSLIRGVQPYAAQSDPEGLATWKCRVFRSGGVDYMYDTPGLPAVPLSVGHLNFWGSQTIFQPVVFNPVQSGSVSQNEIPALVQFNGMVHRSNDAGLTWGNVYCDWEVNGWRGRGYEEMQIHDLDFYSDGRVIEAAQDDGIYSSTGASHPSWIRHSTPAGIPQGTPRSGTGVAVWSDSPVGELILATIGSYTANDILCMYYPGLVAPGSMQVISLSEVLPSPVGIHDIEFTSPGICFATYKYKDGSNFVYGVIRGIWDYNNNAWVWARVDNNLTFTTSSSIDDIDNVVMDLEYMEGTNRLFCATGDTPKLFMLESPTSTVWTQVPGEWDNLEDYSIHEMSSCTQSGLHVLVLAASPNANGIDGTVEEWSGQPGIIYRTENAEAAIGQIIWSVIQQPEAISSDESPKIQTVAISPYDPTVIYFGINIKGLHVPEMTNIGCLHSNTGLWKLDIDGDAGQWTHTWTYELSQTMAEGIVVEDIAFNPFVQGQLVIATGGQGLYYSQLPPPDEPLTAKYVNKSTSVVGLVYPGIPYSEITLDYDNDDREDLLVTLQSGSPKLYRNKGVGNNGVPEFELLTDAFDNTINNLLSARGCAAADYNNDGHVDLFIAHETYPMLLRNKGPDTAPRFENVGNLLTYVEPDHPIQYTLEKSWAGSWVDMDGNDDLDLLVTRADAPGASKLEGSHSKLPLALLINTGNQGGIPFVLMPHLFGSSSTDPVTASSVATADIDGDGWSEILIPSLGGSADTRLYRRTAELPYYYSEFNERFPGADLGGVDAAVWIDLNRDAHPDLVASARYNDAERVRIFMNDPADPGHFIDCTAWADEIGPTTDLRPVDFDLDGWIDLVAVADATTANPGVHLLRNTGDAGLSVGIPYFRDVTAEVGFAADSERVSGLAVADFLGDGDVDLLLGRELDHDTFYFSAVAADGATEPPSSHWTGVRLNVESGANNRSGVGAVVTVEADGVTTTQAIDGGSGLGSQQCTALRFGLGDAVISPEVTVRTRWPGGFEQINDNVTVDSEVIIQDETDPTVIESSLVAYVYYIPDNTLTWMVTWDTAYSYAMDLDRVLITVPHQGTLIYTPSSDHVTASTGRKSSGGYWHRFYIEKVPCELGTYIFTVVSDTHAPQFTVHTTASGQYLSTYCASGEGEPNVIQE